MLEHYPCAAQTESDDVFPPLPICSGFLAFAPGALSLRMLDAQIAAEIANAADDFRIGDQGRLREVIANDPALSGSTFALPEGLFPNGRLDCIAASRGDGAGITGQPLQPFIFHANWTSAANKRNLLDRAGAWFVRDAAFA